MSEEGKIAIYIEFEDDTSIKFNYHVNAHPFQMLLASDYLKFQAEAIIRRIEEQNKEREALSKIQIPGQQ